MISFKQISNIRLKREFFLKIGIFHGEWSMEGGMAPISLFDPYSLISNKSLSYTFSITGY